ncbi:MAG: type II toxin-antitoxin system HicA family toxin [Solobacterium sp.]|nr:type II toxin-antitoxin system HicA family toxin [Solobacterium sp.]
MKRRDLIKRLESAGFVFWRHGANHDIYRRGTVQETIERHSEIPERLAAKILRRNGIR